MRVGHCGAFRSGTAAKTVAGAGLFPGPQNNFAIRIFGPRRADDHLVNMTTHTKIQELLVTR
jgi:hypothetical protein